MDIEWRVRPEVLGARLKAARVSANLSQEALAQTLGLARTTVVAIEAGKRRVSPEELRAFAERLDVRESELLSAGTDSLDMALKFRSVTIPQSDTHKAAVTTLLNHLAAASVELETLLGQPPSRGDTPVVSLSRHAPIEQQAEDASLVLRQRLGIGLGPIADVIGFIELDLGVRVFERPLPSDISGACAYDEDVGSFILTNSKHPASRRRLTALHELCHSLLRRAGVVVHTTADEYSDREERFCDAFARAFLMPAATVRRKASELTELTGRFTVRELLLMANYFHASTEAMTRRMEGLGLLPRGTFEALKERGLGNRHAEVVRAEIGGVQNESTFTPRTLLLAAAAYRRKLLSEQQIAQKLCLDLLAVREVLETVDGGEGEALELAL